MATVTRYQRSKVERAADIALVVFMLVIVVITLYPFVYVVSMSISDPMAVVQQKVWAWPVGFSAAAYKLIFHTDGFLQAYYNTLWYTIVGTFINVAMTVLAAYPLSRRAFLGRKPITIFIIVTLFFSGGLIPTYTLVQILGLYDTRWVMVLLTATDAFLIIVTITFFRTTIPESLIEAARMDGANDIQILVRIVLPLSKPILAVLALFYTVRHWNDYFTPLVYLPNSHLQPLSIFLSKILIRQDPSSMGAAGLDVAAQSAVSIQLKFALIVLVIAPIVCVYPFLQKHFAKGALIGGIKE